MNQPSRKQDFQKIAASLKNSVKLLSESTILSGGDSLSLMRLIPSRTISLVVADPPYHSTKKHNIYGDKSFEEDKHYLEWTSKHLKEWKRILRPNGSIFLFCASEMMARLEIQFMDEFNVLASIVWTKPNDPGFDGWKQKMNKEALRQWYSHSERIIFAEPACEGNLHRSPFAHFLREIRHKTGLTAKDLTEKIGAYGRVNHGGAVSNWETGRNIPSREQYAKLCDAFLATGKLKSLPPYEDVIRPFNVDSSKEFTDVWAFPSVRPYKGKHPAEKPADLLEHIISATTYPGDVVLDCFAGSGSMAVAALKLGRRSVSMDIDAHCVEQIRLKLISSLSKTNNEDEELLLFKKNQLKKDLRLPLLPTS